uniref:Uncharacterized protein n=1 Tax=Romanomermis culicivorax TaxID=13658 RepID=A0A915KXD9_ROMCU
MIQLEKSLAPKQQIIGVFHCLPQESLETTQHLPTRSSPVVEVPIAVVEFYPLLNNVAQTHHTATSHCISQY